MTPTLQRLKSETEAILRALQTRKDEFDGWIDPHCAGAWVHIGPTGWESHVVLIEGVDRMGEKLRVEISRRLKEVGWKDVVVETSW